MNRSVTVVDGKFIINNTYQKTRDEIVTELIDNGVQVFDDVSDDNLSLQYLAYLNITSHGESIRDVMAYDGYPENDEMLSIIKEANKCYDFKYTLVDNPTREDIIDVFDKYVMFMDNLDNIDTTDDNSDY